MKQYEFNDAWLFTDSATGRRETVTLPHDAILNTDRNPDMRNYFLLAGFEGGTFLYEKSLTVQEEDHKKTLILELEASYCMTKVYINDQLASDHPYGFTPIQISLNPYLHYGKENNIRVEVNVPKEGHGRWYTGGGLYRPAHLYVGEEAYIDLYGVKVTTLSHDPALVRVDVSAHGGNEVELDILQDGSSVLTTVVPVQDGRACTELTIPDAALWSAEHPALYQVRATLLLNGTACDTVTETFGIRTIQTDPEQGLLINGEHVFLRGGCIHNDNGVIGVVNNDATELHRARNLKRSGFNAIRSAHHPMSRSLMKACDEVGLYVMDEAFDYWYRPKGQNPHTQHFLSTFEKDTELMVQDAYNHPCVIMYSIGNEIPEAGSLKGVRVGKAIVDVIHSIDTSRLTTLSPSVHWLREYLDGTPYLTVDEDEWLAASEENRKADWSHYMNIFMGAVLNLPDNEKGMAYPPTFIAADEDATKNLYPYLDVAGYNYYEDRYDTLHELHPERILLGTETRGTMIVDTMRYAREHPFLIGDFIWTLQEHLGEANCCGIHYDSPEEQAMREQGKNPEKCYPWLVNYGGVIDLIGTILPSVHLHEFAWDAQKHGLYLASQPPVHDGRLPIVSSYRWTDTVDGWTYEGYEGKKTWVDAYTDAAEVAICINGTEVGRAPVKDYYTRIPCIYQPGELMGIGYDAEGNELYRTVVQSAGAGSRITAIPDKTVLSADGQDFSFIDVTITDADGTLKLLPDRRVRISVEGPAILQGFGSANPKNEEKFNQDSHSTYLGRLQAVLRSGVETGTVTVTFSADGIPDTTVELIIQ